MNFFKTTLAALVTVALAGAAFAAEAEEEGVGGSDFHKNDITYSTEVQTLHVKWAGKLPGGPIKGFFIPGITYGRDMVELMQRLELRPTTVSIDPDWDVNCWGIGDYYSHRYRGDRDDYEIVMGYVEKDLTGEAEFEVMVIPDINGWSRMTRKTRDAILKRVQDGAGLVLIFPTVGDVEGRPFKGDEAEGDIRIWDISAIADCPSTTINEGGYPDYNLNPALAKGKWEYAGRHFITGGVPLELLPEAHVENQFYKYAANGEVLIKSGDHPILAVRTYGKGRVAAFAYKPQGFIPTAVDPVEAGIYWDYWEYYYSLLARAVVWAAGRDPDVVIDSVKAERSVQPKLEIAVSSAGAREVTVEVSARTEFGRPVGTFSSRHELAPGANVLSIDHQAEAAAEGAIGGRVIYDIVISEAGATHDWATALCEWPKPARLTFVAASSDVYKRGETLTGAVKAEGDLEGLTARFSVRDEFDRVITAQEGPAAAEMAFSCPLADYLGDYAFVTAELASAQDRVVDQRKAAGVLVVQDKRRPKEFVANVSFGGGRPFFKNLRGQIVRAAGARPGFVWGGAVNTGLNIPKGSFGVYWYHRGPFDEAGIEKAVAEYEESGDFENLKYNVKKALYERTGDKKFLVRTPCLNDAAVLEQLYTTVRDTAREKAKYSFDYYFVGDEGSLTSYTDPVDFCYGPHTMAEFRRWLLMEYGSLEELNMEWKTEFKDWDSVVPNTMNEAIESGRFAPWADHRTFMEITFAGAYQRVRDAVIAGDPEGHIAVSGTQVTKSQNGCDWYRLDGVIDDFLSYSGGNQWDLHRSFAKPGSMIGFWTGYGRAGIQVQNEIWTAAIHNVLYPNIFWMYSYLDPDFTYSNSARDMGEAFKALRFEGVAKLFLESQRLQDAVALHYSMPSMHAASITFNEPERGRERDQMKRNFSGDRDGWVRTIKDLAMQFDFVSYEQVAMGKLEPGQYKAFIMPFSMALSTEEIEGIKAFAESGGAVIADAAAGVMNEHCTWQEEGLLNDFFGIKTAPSARRAFTGAAGEVEVTGTGWRWGLEAKDLAGLEAAEKDLEVTAGTALVTVGGTPVAVVRQVGEGWAIYLNVLYDRLGGGRRRRGEEAPEAPKACGELARAVLAHVGVKPAVEVLAAGGAPLEQALVARYEIGGGEILAIVKADVSLEGIEGRDGVTFYDDAKLGRIATQDITIRLPRAYYVTDVRTGESHGYTETVKTAVTVGLAKVLALSPAENELGIEGPAEAARGEHPAFSLTSRAGSKRVVRCHFFAPDGSFVPHYAANVVAERGKAGVVLPSALNDPTGQWRLKATDLLTGATAEATITLK